jgi:predicted DNA-binding protein (MmcQ/YjbR family)
MNKKYWISIVLDRTADIPFIEKLLDASYGLVEGKT